MLVLVVLLLVEGFETNFNCSVAVSLDSAETLAEN